MKAILLNNEDVVINFIEVDTLSTIPNCVEYKEGVSFGDIYDHESGLFVTGQVPPPLQVISIVSPRQIRQALTRAGLREAVETAVSSGDQDTKDWYEFATEFDRYHEHVLMLAEALNVSESDLDNLWILAASL